MRGSERVAATSTSSGGEYTFQGVESGRYQIQVEAPGFESYLSGAVFVGSGQITITVALRIGPLQQEMVVTAAAMGCYEKALSLLESCVLATEVDLKRVRGHLTRLAGEG
jgi:hypothetical protein